LLHKVISAPGEVKSNPDEWSWTIGTVVAPFGLLGEMKVRIESDFPDRYEGLEKVCLRLPKRAPLLFAVKRTRIHKGQVLLKVEGIDRIEDAEDWRGASVQIPRSQAVKLSEGSYYAVDLIGMDVVTREGRSLGKLENILPYPAQDLFKVGEILIPAVKEFILNVDIAGKRIVVALPEGLIPEPAGSGNEN
jgi:16S rRNA processing protein RimM